MHICVFPYRLIEQIRYNFCPEEPAICRTQVLQLSTGEAALYFSEELLKSSSCGVGHE